MYPYSKHNFYPPKNTRFYLPPVKYDGITG